MFFSANPSNRRVGRSFSAVFRQKCSYLCMKWMLHGWYFHEINQMKPNILCEIYNFSTSEKTSQWVLGCFLPSRKRNLVFVRKMSKKGYIHSDTSSEKHLQILHSKRCLLPGAHCSVFFLSNKDFTLSLFKKKNTTMSAWKETPFWVQDLQMLFWRGIWMNVSFFWHFSYKNRFRFLLGRKHLKTHWLVFSLR